MTEGWKERRERLKREAREASGRVRLTYDSQNARSEVSVSGDVIETDGEKEQLRLDTSERKYDLVVDHNATVRSAPSGSWGTSLGDLVAVEELDDG